MCRCAGVCVCPAHRDVQGVDLHVSGTVDWSFSLVAGDVEQRAVLELVRPLDLQRGFTECTGPIVQQLRADTVNDCWLNQSCAEHWCSGLFVKLFRQNNCSLTNNTAFYQREHLTDYLRCSSWRRRRTTALVVFPVGTCSSSSPVYYRVQYLLTDPQCVPSTRVTSDQLIHTLLLFLLCDEAVFTNWVWYYTHRYRQCVRVCVCVPHRRELSVVRCRLPPQEAL